MNERAPLGRIGRPLFAACLAGAAALLASTEMRLRKIEVSTAVIAEQLKHHQEVVETELTTIRGFMEKGERVVPSHLLVLLDAMLHRSASDFSERDYQELLALRRVLREELPAEE